jgi:DNA primase
VIRFVELYDKVDFAEAVKRLSGNNPKPTPAKARKKAAARQTVKDKKLLGRVMRLGVAPAEHVEKQRKAV